MSKSLLPKSPLKTNIFSVDLNIVHPLPPADGYRFHLTRTDHFTRWPMAVPVTDRSRETVSKASLHQWIPTSGVPSKATINRGT